MSATLTGSATLDNLFASDYPRVFDYGTVADGQTLAIGAAVGKVTVAAGTAAADAGNTGDGAVSAFALAAGGPALVGDYLATCVEAVTNSGKFVITDPNGAVVGWLNGVGTFTGGGITFAIADGANDFIVGDFITFPVAAGSGQLKKVDKTATDGSQVPWAVMTKAVTTSGATAPGPVVRTGEFNSASLSFVSGTAYTDVLAQMNDANMYVKVQVASVTGEIS